VPVPLHFERLIMPAAVAFRETKFLRREAVPASQEDE
jgi:hypothetical protein